ncbi:MAG: glycosyltransferase family 2 protein [Cyclobacteriaceae bacterium]
MKISVLTPSYNSGKYIERAINSVLKQGYFNWEHIIVDGQSKDNTTDIFRKHPHLKWLSEPDRGQSDAMNKAFRMSSGDIIVYLNADDEFKDHAFEEVIDAFNQVNVDMVVGQLEMTFSNGFSKIKKPSVRIDEIINYWPCRFPGNPVSYFYKRSLQEKIGDFPLNNHYSMDYWFLLRAYHSYRVYKIDEVLGTFHVTESSKSADVDRGKKSLKKTRNEFLIEAKNVRFILVIVKNNLLKLIRKFRWLFSIKKFFAR